MSETGDAATARRRLNEVIDDEAAPVDERVRRALGVGCAFLGLPEGHVKRLAAVPGAVVQQTNPDAELITTGTELDHPGFCAETADGAGSLAVADALVEGYDDSPGYTDHGVACYLGAPVTVDGEPYGTVCFGSPEPRSESFSPTERTFVELLAATLGRLFTRTEYAEAVERSRRKYRSLVETAGDAVVLVDREAERVVEANAAAAELLATTTDALVGRDYRCAIPASDDVPLAFLLSADRSRERGPDGEPLILIDDDGERCPVSVDAETVVLDGREHVQLVIRDIADRRRRERRAEAVFDQTHGFTGLLAPDGTVLEVNQTALSFVGVDREAVIGRPFPETPWWDVATEHRDRLRDALDRAADGEFVRYETPVSGVDGERTIDFSVRPVTDERGQVEMLIPEGKDVTARVERDRQLSVLSRVLRHNFRNDVGVLSAFADGIAEGSVDDPAATAARIGNRARRLADRVATYREAVELLTDPPERCRLDAVTLVDEAVDALTAPAATVRTDLPATATVRAVPALSRAVTELLTNAVEHTGSSPTVRVGVTVADDTVRVTVADDGPGLPEPERRVLTGEQSVDPLHHAEGVDLWLVYWILDLSDGSVEVTVDDGTTVTLSLPRVTPSGP